MRFVLTTFALVCLMVLTAGAATTAPAFQFTCTTTAQRIAPPSGRADYTSITVWNAACSGGTCTTSSTPVFLGGTYNTQTGAQTSAVTTATGMPVCDDTAACIATAATYEVKNLECIAGSSVTVTVQVAR